MTEKKRLFDEFPSVTAEQWIQQVIKDLKGEDFNSKLKYTSVDGIVIEPFYTMENLTQFNECKPLFGHTDWEVCELIVVEDEKKANKKALHVLNNGATGLVFKVAASVSLTELLKDVKVEYIATQFIVTGDLVEFSLSLNAYLESQKLDPLKLNIAIYSDALSNGLTQGEWQPSIELVQQQFASILTHKNNFRNLVVDAVVFHNGGASPAFEIACALSQMNELAGWANAENNKGLNGKFQANVAIGPNYFFEIAKLRAYRKTMALLLETYKLESEIYIHAETAFRNLTVYDAHNNLLRATTEAMAATIGGCNSLRVLPFDAAYAAENDFSERMARNIQLILKTESYFDKVADVSAGTYFIETLTEQLAEKAWAYFVEIENQGGYVKAVESGYLQKRLQEFADKQQSVFDEGKEILIGTNKFPNTKEQKKAIEQAIVFGDAPSKGKEFERLGSVRISSKNEKERLKSE